MAAISGFQLIIDPSHMSYYGNVPDTPLEHDGTYEEYLIGWDDKRVLAEEFAPPINELCGTLLDYCDVDYFDAKDQCPKLRDWLIDRLAKPCEPHLAEVYTALLDYAERAIELGTGVVVEL